MNGDEGDMMTLRRIFLNVLFFTPHSSPNTYHYNS